MIAKITLILTLFIFIVSCDGGLEPPDPASKSYLNVKFNFVGGKDAWPDSTEMFGFRLGAIRQNIIENPITVDSLIKLIIQGEAYLTLESIPMHIDTASVSIEIKSPDTLRYIAGVWQNDSTLYDQIIAGVYTESGDPIKNSTLIFEKGQSHTIEINIDFNNLPPNPLKEEK
jgi:hypothetical protein